MTNDDDHVTVAILKSELAAYRQFVTLQFQHLEQRLDAHCTATAEVADDHEARIRSLEKNNTVTRIVEGMTVLVGGIVALFQGPSQ